MEVSIKLKLKELLNHGVIFGITSSLQNVLGFVLLPILTSYYTTSDFGVYSIILLASSLASAIFYLGANSALGRFYYDEDTAEFRKKIISTALFITFIGAAVLITLALILGEKLSIWLFHSPDYALHIKLSLSSAAFGFLLNTMTLILRYEKRSWMFMTIILAGVLTNFSITYILLTRYHYGLLAPIYGLFFSSGLSFLFLLVQYLKNLTVFFNKSHVYQILTFGLQSSVTGLLFYLLDWVDRLIIKDLLPMSDVGIYSLGYRLGSVMNILLIVPFSLIWGPIRMQYAQNTNNKEFVARVISYFSMVGIAIVFVAVLFGEDLMNLFFKNHSYADAAKLYPIIMLSMLFFGFQNIVDFGIYLHKKVYFYIIISGIGLVFNVGMNYWLIPHFGYIAAAYVTLLTYTVTTMLIYFASRSYYKLHIEWQRLIGPLVFLLAIYFMIAYSNFFNSFSLIKKAAVVIAALVLFIKFWLNKSEINNLNRLIAKK